MVGTFDDRFPALSRLLSVSYIFIFSAVDTVAEHNSLFAKLKMLSVEISVAFISTVTLSCDRSLTLIDRVKAKTCQRSNHSCTLTCVSPLCPRRFVSPPRPLYISLIPNGQSTAQTPPSCCYGSRREQVGVCRRWGRRVQMRLLNILVPIFVLAVRRDQSSCMLVSGEASPAGV